MVLNNENNGYNFTEMSRSVKREMDERFKNLHSEEEVCTLIDDFVTVPADGRGDIERSIVQILAESDKYTGYFTANKNQLLCDDRTSDEKVRNAAHEYRKYAAKLPKDDDVDGLFLAELCDMLQNFRPSVDYMERIVRSRLNALCPELLGENDSARVLILKQFLISVDFPKNTEHFSRAFAAFVLEKMGCDLKAGKQSRVATVQEIAKLDDSVFEKLSEMPEKGKDAQKDFKEKWEWLIWADDLANANFDNQHTIRRKLYIFAIVFGMTYNTGAVDEVFDESSDIEKNLFSDYYSDNLLDSILNGGKKTSGRDKEPSGHGINYKNFVEVIYLYYLHKNGLSTNEKLLLAEKMIKKCETNNADDIALQEKKHSSKSTQYYMTPILSGVMNMDEDEFYQFIKENYILGQKGVNVIRVAEKNLSAASVYNGLFECLSQLVTELSDSCRVSNDVIYSLLEKKYYEEIRCQGCSRRKKENSEKLYKECPYYEQDCRGFYAEYVTESRKPEEWRRSIRENIVKENIFPLLKNLAAFDTVELCDNEEFRELVKKIEHKLKIKDKHNIKEAVESTFMPDGDVSQFVTRSKLIVLYYYVFVLTYRAEGALSKLDFSGFKGFYDEFCEDFELYIGDDSYYGLNTCLMEAGYQPVDPKNLFDMLIIFMAFKKYKFDN